jgi:predicted GNAT family acetyltransferase
LTEILREDRGRSGRYVMQMNGAEAELTWARVAPGVIDANHTFVPEAMRGSGAAAKLVERLVADARAEGLRIVPSCSYVAAQFRRHPDWADLLARPGA